MIQETVFTALAPLVQGKCYPSIAPDHTTPPYLVYTRVASTPENTLADGQPIQQARLQIDIYAQGYAAAQALAGQVEAAMIGLNNAAPAPDGRGVVMLLELDEFEADLKYHRIIHDYSIWHY
jgi:hypothetical protein